MDTIDNQSVLTREFLEKRSERNFSEISSLGWNNCNFNGFMREKPHYMQEPNHACFYDREYTKMLFEIKEERVRNDKREEQLNELLQSSLLADEGFRGGGSEFMRPLSAVRNEQSPSMMSIESLLQWKRGQDEKHNLFMSSVRLMEQEDFERSKWSQRHPKISKKVEVDARLLEHEDFERSKWTQRHPKISKKVEVDASLVKRTGDRLHPEMERAEIAKVVDDNGDEVKLCRHFVGGYCKLGDACNFKHCEQSSYPDSQKVFLGGLPQSVTTEILVQELMKRGFNVLNKPKIFRRFSPQVCLGSIEQAQIMLRLGTVSIDGCDVDVRPYKAHTQKELNRQLNINNRSVFLGGVPSTMTVRILKSEIERMGMKVTNHPQIKAGFIPKVTLASAHQAKQLIAKCVIDVNGANVSVRPYMLNINRS